MHKSKILIIITIFILSVNVAIPVYADDEIEDIEMTTEEMQEILETTVDITDIPIINSRNAVIYDRSSRKHFIWEK